MERSRKERWAWMGVLGGAAVVALVSARPHAGSWNDGSRLATVESLVERGTLKIDESIFVVAPVSLSPYRSENRLLHERGTSDKLLIDGHYYSEKSPVPAFYLAAPYAAWRWLGGPTAAEWPDLFCWFMNLIGGGLPFVVAVGCLFAIAGRLGLPLGKRVLLAAAFGLGTIALPYAQYVNNHMLFLAAASWLFLLLVSANRDGWTTGRLLGIGSAVGIAYTIDLGAGPSLFVTVAGLLVAERLSRRQIALTWLAALPWFVFHHAVNWSIGGTIGPANAVPEYLAWPGSPFNPGNMTGGWQHDSLREGVIYALDLLFGKKGFLSHNLLLLLPLVALPLLLRLKCPEQRIVLMGLLWCVGTWLLYAVTSNNYSGFCCSIRWLLPTLAPAYLLVAIIMRERPTWTIDACILGVASVALGVCMAVQGPWYGRVIPGFWGLYAASVFAWGSYRLWRWRQPRATMPAVRIENQLAVKWGVDVRPQEESIHPTQTRQAQG